MEYFYLMKMRACFFLYMQIINQLSFLSDSLLKSIAFTFIIKEGRIKMHDCFQNQIFVLISKVLQFKELCGNYSVLFIIIQMRHFFFISKIMVYFIQSFHRKLCMCESSLQSKSHLQFMTSFHPNYLVPFPLHFISFNFQTHIHLTKIAIILFSPCRKSTMYLKRLYIFFSSVGC